MRGFFMLNIRKHKIRLIVAIFLWSILLVVLALEPDTAVNACLPKHVLRDLAHSAAYGMLAVLCYLYFHFKRHVLSHRMTERSIFICSFLIASGWGIFTEILQYFSPTRHAEFSDIFYDMAGAFVGIVFFILTKKKLKTFFLPLIPKAS